MLLQIIFTVFIIYYFFADKCNATKKLFLILKGPDEGSTRATTLARSNIPAHYVQGQGRLFSDAYIIGMLNKILKTGFWF